MRIKCKRLKDEGNETVTNCNALKMQGPDGKMRMTDVADTVPKKEIVTNSYDLNLSTYKEEVYEEVKYEKPKSNKS